jgi:DNA repair protein RadC
MANRKHFERSIAKKEPQPLRDKPDSELVEMAFGKNAAALVQNLGGVSDRLLDFETIELVLQKGIGYATAIKIEATVILAARWKARNTI